MIFEKNKDFQAWDHVGSYSVGIFRLMIELHKRGVCMTDLKPANTLYDPMTRTAKLVDLAGVVREEKLDSCKMKKITEITLKYAAPEIVDKYNDSDCDEDKIDLKKCIAYTVGKMIKEMIERIEETSFEKIENEVKSLHQNLMKIDPDERLSLEEGLERLEKIRLSTKNIFDDNYEEYVNDLKDKFDKEDVQIR